MKSERWDEVGAKDLDRPNLTYATRNLDARPIVSALGSMHGHVGFYSGPMMKNQSDPHRAPRPRITFFDTADMYGPVHE